MINVCTTFKRCISIHYIKTNYDFICYDVHDFQLPIDFISITVNNTYYLLLGMAFQVLQVFQGKLK